MAVPKVKVLAGSALAVFLLAACSDTLPQSTLNPAGPLARTDANLYKLVFIIAMFVFVLVEGLIIFFVLKYRARPGGRAEQIHGNTRMEIAWTIAPIIVLAIIAVPTVKVIWDQSGRPEGKVIDVDVIGHQWWWEFRYPDDDVISANVLVIPTDIPVYIRLCSSGSTGPTDPKTGVASGPATGQPCTDPASNLGNAVIHSFWVPRLNGKTDVVPGRTNTMTLQADEPGVYLGQCAEFCSWSHANMRFKVQAMAPADYEAWLVEQQADAVVPAPGSLADKGMQDFATGSCIGCHAVKGLETTSGAPAAAIQGPDLTHFASRDCFAGCMFETSTEHIKTWLKDPPAVKPGSFMPNYKLTPDQIDALTAYLESLT